MDNTDYKNVLLAALRDDRCKLSEDQVQTIVKRYFEPIASKNGGKAAFMAIFNEYGSGEPSQMLASYASTMNIKPLLSRTAQVINDNLEDINNTHTVKTNPIQRTRDAIKRYRANLGKVSGATLTNARYTNIDILSPDEIASLVGTQSAKDNALNMAYQSWSSYRDFHNLGK